MWTRGRDSGGRVSAFELDLISPDGALLGRASETTSFLFLTVPLTEGAGAVQFDGDVQGTLVRVDSAGSVSRQPAGMVRSVSAFPGGGVVVGEGGSLYLMDGGMVTAPVQITRRDAAGAVVWSTPIPASIATDAIDVQVFPNGAGHVFAIVALDSFQVRVVWLDQLGHIVSTGDPQGTFSSRASTSRALELPDGSLAFGISPAHSSQGWVVVHDLDPALDLPPCWLDQRRETRIDRIHGGHGYAVFHGSTFLGNEPRHGLEIVTLAGVSCGWVEASCDDPTHGACDLPSASVGMDGTLFLNAVTAGDPEHCLIESWPGLLR